VIPHDGHAHSPFIPFIVVYPPSDPPQICSPHKSIQPTSKVRSARQAVPLSATSRSRTFRGYTDIRPGDIHFNFDCPLGRPGKYPPGHERFGI
jgi:hypothetical protein